MSNVVFESSTRAFIRKASQSLNGAGAEVGSFIHDFSDLEMTAIADRLIATETELVAIGPELDLDKSLKLANEIARKHPEVSVVLITEPSPKVWEPALRAGVADVINPGAPIKDIDRALKAVLDRSKKRRDNLAKTLPPATEPSVSPTETKRVITVVSPKGGSGKTMTSTNLALGLAVDHPGQVVLVDLDLEFGDVTNALLLNPDHTIQDAVQTKKLDITTLKVFLTAHPSGLFVLCAPAAPEDGETVKPSDASRIIDLLRSQFKYVVIDTAGGLSETTLSSIEASTDLVLMTALDVASVRALSKAVDALDRLGMTKQQRHFVLNRANAKVGLLSSDVEETVGLPVDVQIQSSRAVPVSMNQGSPLLESNPRSRIGKQLSALVHRFSEEPAAAGPIWKLGR